MDKYEYIVNTSKDFITLINKDYVYEIVNESYCEAIDRKKVEILNKSVAEVWGDDTFGKVIKDYLDTAFSGQNVHYIDKFKFGSFEKHMHVSYYPYCMAEGNEITHVLVFSHDITHISEIESKLTNYEYRDPVTGLFNRRSLDIILDKEIQNSRRSDSAKSKAVLFLRIENLAKVNRIYGYGIGDLLLENTGLRIQTCVRNSDYVFRFVGGELTVLLTNIARTTDVAKIAQKIYDSVAMPYEFKGDEIFITCAIGVSVYPADGDDRDSIIQNASSAMTEALKSGEQFVVYNKELHAKAVARMHLESDMNKAFEGSQYELYYHPIVDPDGRILGAEALIRWHHPEKGLIPPFEFIPVAEETRMIDAIGKWVVYTACKQIKAWTEDLEIFISVNLTVREFASENLLEIVKGALRSADDLDPRYLKLEITESECMENPEKIITNMIQLEKLGVQSLIDDFGTGNSSLSYLKRIPAKILKIAKIFVDDLETSESEREYLSNILGLIKSRNKDVIIEGVTSEGQVELLRVMDCHMLQGYYFAKPLPVHEFERFLKSGITLPGS